MQRACFHQSVALDGQFAIAPSAKGPQGPRVWDSGRQCLNLCFLYIYALPSVPPPPPRRVCDWYTHTHTHTHIHRAGYGLSELLDLLIEFDKVPTLSRDRFVVPHFFCPVDSCAAIPFIVGVLPASLFGLRGIIIVQLVGKVATVRFRGPMFASIAAIRHSRGGGVCSEGGQFVSSTIEETGFR